MKWYEVLSGRRDGEGMKREVCIRWVERRSACMEVGGEVGCVWR